jgi:hypothetical protein
MLMLETLIPLPASRTNTPIGHRVSRIDAILATALAAATLTIGLYFAPRGFQGGFVDMAHDGYQLRQALDLSRGGVIFRDTFDQYGPLNGYLNTVGFLALGHRLVAMKYFICGWYALIAVALYAMARQWLSPALAAFSGFVWLALAPFYRHGMMVSPHVYALLFQSLATIVTIRSPRLEARRLLIVGILAALSWSVKQSFGTLYLLAILVYLVFRVAADRADWRRVTIASLALSAGFFSVVLVALAWLWTQGALRDWYLQTVVFPREFYVQELIASRTVSRPSPWTALLTFAQLQWEWPSWIVIRTVVLLTAAVQLIRRRFENDLLLMAPIAAILWLGAYPSANFMHQWWTASLTIAPFVVCVRKAFSHFIAREGAVSPATVGLVCIVIIAGVIDRAQAATERAEALTETLDEPPLFRGIRTDPQTKRAFLMLDQSLARYRSHHPDTNVVSIESSDGWWHGVAESLPLLSFFEGNTHSQPVYWSLPALSTTIYPRYGELLWNEVRVKHPLIVDHRTGRYRQAGIAGYSLLAAAQSDYGYWYIYAPNHEERASHGEVSTFLKNDGWMERGFAERGRLPRLSESLNPSVEGAWRGRVLAPSEREGDGTFHLRGADPLEILDDAVGSAAGPVDVYTWPADLKEARLDLPVEPVSAEVSWRADRGDIVRDLRAGAWTVDGHTSEPFSYLLQWREEPVARNALFVARGELLEGGLQIGFLKGGQWSGFVIVTREGLFEAVLQIQKPGRYGLVVANCLQPSWLRTPFGGRNHFRISEAGWIKPQF